MNDPPKPVTDFGYYWLMILDFLLKRIRRAGVGKLPDHRAHEDDDENELLKLTDPFADPIVIEFRDVLDLHSIPPRQVKAVVEDYLEEARLRGVRWVRIIHGKGIGVQRETVRSILAQKDYILDFRDASAETGGWGATVVTLNVPEKNG